MRDRIYRMLVNRVPEIRDRYLERRPMSRFQSLLYLLWLNVRYCLPRSAGKILYSEESESSLSRRESPEAFAARLARYDVISFDVFDTLIFRWFSRPDDVFYLAGLELKYPDFKRIRTEAEARARQNKEKVCGSREVTFEEIWDVVAAETGISKEAGMRVEWACEKRCCFANPYMLRTVQELQRQGKTVVATSDMYLGEKYARELLTACGYEAPERCYVSCDYGASKSDGGLYEVLREKVGKDFTLVHVGDNVHSDQKQAQSRNIQAFLYANVNHRGAPYRAEDMSRVTGSLYRGLVNARLHSGLHVLSREYEYGFVYGGLFVAGYCRFIHDYAKTQGVDKILFLSRDGSVLQQAYAMLYPEETENTVYAYWSRLAALKITARYFKYDYFRRFLYHKVNQRYSVRRILQGMELTCMLDPLCRTLKITPDTELTNKNVESIKNYFMDAWPRILAEYEAQRAAGGIYYGKILRNCKKAAAVDIGWAGSGAVMLDCAVNKIWNMECEITGILAGTNTRQSPEADAAEAFLWRGQLVSYLYSQRENRDLWKFHDPAKGHNLYWELLLGAPEGSLTGFYPDDEGYCICKCKDNAPGTGRIREIHRGILDFVRQFLEMERQLGHTVPISGRDAYAPMQEVCREKNKKFMKGLEELLDEVHIG